MGFAASQARLLLLTARKSDLEFRAQQITNAEMALARQTETIATEYARKLSNQTLKVIANGEPVPFTASTLSSLSNGGYKLQVKVNGTWQNWVPTNAPAGDTDSTVIDDTVETPKADDADGDQSPTPSGNTTPTPVPTPVTFERIPLPLSDLKPWEPEPLKSAPTNSPAGDTESTVIDDTVETPVPTDADGSQSPTASGNITPTPVPTPDASGLIEVINTPSIPQSDGAEDGNPSLPAVSEDENSSSLDSASYSQQIIKNDYTGAQILQGIANGTMRIVDANGYEVDPNSNTQFTVCYDTSDDAEADAKYRSETAALQVKEKRLQMELQQVEAQQKACDAEIESVKKIMDKHIDKAFKVFS